MVSFKDESVFKKKIKKIETKKKDTKNLKRSFIQLRSKARTYKLKKNT
jgi:hypothetical protein